MGEYADDIVASFIGQWFNTRRPRRATYQSGAGEGKWRDGDGRVRDMDRMSVGHLRAALKVCEARGSAGKADQLRKAIEKKIITHFKPVDNP